METQGAGSDQAGLSATLGLIARRASEALGGTAGVVATWREEEHRFAVDASYGLDDDVLTRLAPLLEEAVPDLSTSQESFGLVSRLNPDMGVPLSDTGVGQDPIIVLPLRSDGSLTGLIYVLRSLDAAEFSAADRPILHAFAEQAAMTIQNARLAYLLAEEKKRLEQVLETSADGIMSIDGERRIASFNTAMEKLTGYSKAEVLGERCSAVLRPSDQEGNLCDIRCPMLTSARAAGTTVERIGTIQTKDRGELHVSMAYSIARSLGNRPTNAVVNVRDLTRFWEAENLREVFLSMLGHELQTPLSIIKGYAGTLARSDSQWSKETIRDGLHVIEEESERLAKLVSKLLLASRLSVGAPPLEKEPVQLASVAAKVVGRLKAVTTSRRFDTDFAPDFPPVPADPALIEEVLTNLVENAVKYSPEGGRIVVSGRVVGGQAVVSVADEGVGIAPEDLEHIFERFQQAGKDTGDVRSSGGTGLGLYICRSIVEAHGGSLSVSSQPGVGSEFEVALPLQGTAEA